MGGLLNVRLALASRGKRCLDLAKELDMGSSRLSLIINGHIDPGPEFKRKCAAALGVPEGWLFSKTRRIPTVERANPEQQMVAAG
ncbi:MAG: helix-turn-helix transcriptional regulator [Terriglobia bacterium]